MIRFTFLCFSILLASSNLFANEVICTPSIPKRLDPHQSHFPVDQYLSSLAYRSLLGTEGKPEGVIESLESTDQLNWKLKIRKNLKFNSFDGWKPLRDLDSSDVVFSINRQLTRNAVTQFDLKTFNTVKYNGLEKVLVNVKASSASEVTLSFKEKTSQADLINYLAPPVGFVISKEFYDYKTKLSQRINFYPPSTDLTFSEISNIQISLTPLSEIAKPVKKGTYVFKGFRSQEATLSMAKEAGCRRVYFAGKKLTDDLTKNSRRFRKQVVSRTKVFLQLNSKLKISNADLLELRWLLNPEKLVSIKGMETVRGLFNKSEAFVFAGNKSSPLTQDPVNVKDLITCEIPQLAGKNLDLSVELKKILRQTLRYQIYKVSTEACELLPVYSDLPTSIGSINTFTYKTSDELTKAFRCDLLTRKPFGFCVAGKNPQEKEIEAESLKFMRVFPLLDIENYFIYIF